MISTAALPGNAIPRVAPEARARHQPDRANRRKPQASGGAATVLNTNRLAGVSDVARMLGAILERLCHDFEEELGFEGGRIYTRENDAYVLSCGFGTSRDAPCGLRVPRNYPPHRRLLAEGLVLMARGAGVDEEFEKRIGVRSMFAAIGVGEATTHIIAFSLQGEPREEDVFFSLSLVRHVINLKLQQRRMPGIIDAARILQEGILPKQTPRFGDFDIAAVSRPADLVSGDLFDYLPVSGCCLGIAIADSSGGACPRRNHVAADRGGIRHAHSFHCSARQHGDPACRSFRGFRFLVLRPTFRRGSAGILQCRARTAAVARPRDNSATRRGGMVLGPIPAARYESATTALDPGDLLLLYTDGISERVKSSGDFFGADRIDFRASMLLNEPASQVAATLLAEVAAFACGILAQDDMTVVATRRPLPPAA